MVLGNHDWTVLRWADAIAADGPDARPPFSKSPSEHQELARWIPSIERTSVRFLGCSFGPWGGVCLFGSYQLFRSLTFHRFQNLNFWRLVVLLRKLCSGLGLHCHPTAHCHWGDILYGCKCTTAIYAVLSFPFFQSLAGL